MSQITEPRDTGGPDLLSALIGCVEHMEHSTDHGRQAFEQARAVIAKALVGKPQAYKLTAERFGRRAGTIVYECKAHDYGCARDDAMATGEPHISVTEYSDGTYPFFTVPTTQLEKVQ